MHWKRLSTLLLVLGGTEGALAHAQTDVGLSFYGAFSGTATASGEKQTPSNSPGGLIELRHISNPIIGFEGTYSYNRNDQTYSPTIAITCPVNPPSPCPPPPETVPANAHEITGDWVPSLKVGNLRPFGILGAGVLLNQPTGGLTGTMTANRAVWVYGAGLDWGVLPHLGLRFQYRGNLYKAPNLTSLYGSVDAFVHTAEPMVGAYFRF
jgi:hypothetical protein